MNSIVEGLIYTNEDCVGCNKCIGVCSCPGATIATESLDGNNVIRIDGSRCVACGACFDACEHHAREYVDDTLSFFADLKKGEDISILFAPAFVANYPNEYKSILGKLKALGVNRIISVAFGADITTWGYLNYISKNNAVGMISQPCPATVDYIEKYIPDLIPKLMPIQSPVMCAAIYARKHMGLTGKMAFISPCIAKKSEIMSERGMGLISYNVTFDHLMKTLRNMDVEAMPYEEDIESGLGSVYPVPGGLAENIHWFLGEDAFVRSVEGEKKMYQFLENNKDRILANDSPYAMYDVLNCSDGCLCGTGVELGVISKEDVNLQLMQIRRASKNKSKESAWSALLSPEERLAALNKQFSELNLDDYICAYSDKSNGCDWSEPTEKELDVIFEHMNKSTPESRQINCSSCGYANCREMAKAIYNGFNHKENCVHFLKDVLSGISADFPTVLLINRHSHSIHVVKYAGEGAIRSWIDSGLSLIDYNTAIKDYIDRYVDAADKERVWQNVEFSALLNHLRAANRYEIVYFRHPETGEPGYFKLSFNRERGSENIVLGFRDIDETVREEQKRKKELEKALREAEQANKIKSTFLANMSHEIRTPINAILGMDTMILRESTQDNVIEYAKNVKSAGDSLLSMINDILDFSMMDSGKADETLHVESTYVKSSEEKRESFHAPQARVLVVDDVEMNITVLISLLKRIQIKPDSCMSGKKAVEMAMANKYDIIFMDAMMPEMSGVEALHEIRKTCELNAQTPIIVLTANAVIGAREKYLKEGFNNYMSKPLDGPKLEKLISEYLPEEKMVKVSESDAFKEPLDELSDSDKKMLETLDMNAHISTKDGISAIGDVATYISICKNFYDTSISRIEMIRDFFEKKDAANYTIQVHALKSSARLVGAGELSANALRLEMAGRENDWVTITNETASIISMYEEIAGAIGAAASCVEDESDKEEISEKKLNRRLSELLELVDAFDMESAKELMKGFEKYRLPESGAAIYRKVKALMADVNRDEIINLLKEHLGV